MAARPRRLSPNTTRISSTVRRWKRSSPASATSSPRTSEPAATPGPGDRAGAGRHISEYKKPGPWNIRFSNAAVDNSLAGGRLADVMQNQVERAGDEIADFNAVDAEASDDEQSPDIQSLTRSGNCDALIASPNTTATLTPAVEQACDTGVPVDVFDRGADTDCPAAFIKPIGATPRRGRRRVPGRQRRPGRQDPRVADPAWSRRPGDAVVRGPGGLR